MLHIHQLSLSIADRSLLQQVSLDIAPGQTLGLVGESGSGKSLTALAIMRLLPAGIQVSEGSISLAGQSVLQHTERQMCALRGRVVSMIFQDPMTALNPTRRCGQQVAEVLRLHGRLGRRQAREQVLQCLAEVQLPEPAVVYRKYPHQLSGGQLQRVMIAMAIACKPQLLIADEPTTALDVTVQRQVLALLRQLQQRHGMAMLFISHDLNVVSAIANHIAVMQQGRVVEQGTAQQIMQHARHPYTRHLLSCAQLPLLRPQAVSAQVVLSVRGLTTQFALRRNLLGRTVATYTAVNNLSFDLYRGETLGLVGESGCGKTTLGRSMMQLVPSQQGQVYLHGQPMLGMGRGAVKQFRQQVQLVFQDPYSSLNPRLTVEQCIVEPMRVHGLAATTGQARERCAQLLEQVGLNASYLSRYPHQLSGGQRQRIVIARALAVQPQVLILDESVSALDVSVQAQVLQLLHHLQQQMGLSYLFISHDLQVVRQVSSRVMVMRQGCMVELAPTDTLFDHPRHPYVQQLVASHYS